MITTVERRMLERKVSQFGGISNSDAEDRVNDMLEKWSEAKSKKLFKMFGDKLILKKDILVEKSFQQIEKEFRRASFDIKEAYFSNVSCTDDIHELPWSDKHFIRELFSDEVMAKNQVPESATIEWRGKKYKFSSGQKLTKAYRLLVDMFSDFGLTEDLVEKFRIKQSQILNDKVVKGELCLSIHPLDYITLSDNNNDWDSCLSWDNCGCHRAGTLELLNCENTVVVYIAAESRNYRIGCDEWNSKKWRQLAMVTDEIVMTNKGYPFRNDQISMITLDWLTELAKEVGIEYEQEVYDYDDGETSIPGVNYLNVHVENMYDDTDNGSNAFLRKTADHCETIDLYIGGQAYCLSCGCAGVDDCESLLCYDCRDEHRCEQCDDLCSSADLVSTPDGSEVCQYCYDRYYSSCDCCGGTERNYHMIILDEEDSAECGIPEGQYCSYCFNEKKKEVIEKQEDEKTRDAIFSIKPITLD